MNIVITGASKGFGRAIAQIFAEKGNTLLLTSRKEADLHKVKEELTANPDSCKVLLKAADLSVPEQAKAFGQWVLEHVGAPDILVNNAGLFNPGNISTEAEGSLNEMIHVNLYSAYHLTRTVLPAMMAKKSGHIFNICSIASLAAYDNGGAYSISKFALYGFSKNLRKELMPQGIKVTHVIPGAAYTDSWSGSGIDPKRIMEAEDIAKMIKAAASLSVQACVEEIVMRPQLGDL